MSLKNLLLTLLLVIAALFATSCTVQAPETAKADNVLVASQPPSATCTAPVVTAVLVDHTGSANQNRTPELTTSDFHPIYELLGKCGGELALGEITSRSNRPLLRVRVDEPDLEAVPDEADPHQNPYDYAREKLDRDERRKHAMAVNEERESARTTEAGEALRAFDQAAGPLLAGARSASCSDIFGALNRASLFHNEPATTWTHTPKRFTALVSDAKHNCGEKLAPAPAGVKLLLINGAPGDGSAPKDNLVRLESFPAAVRLIISTSK